MKTGLRIFLYGVFSLLFFVVAVNALIYISSKPFIFNDVSDVPMARVALVPGAAVSEDGTLSPIFIDRVDLAIALYRDNKVTKILVSGDNSTVDYNEVNPARLYLLSEGVSEVDIYLDHAGFDTYSSMYRARDIFKVSSMLITTQSFHLPRAVFIARHLGIDAHGVNADKGHILFRNTLRELLANEKAFFELVFRTQPKFLGDEIPIP